ncbi:MAG: Fic family protein [Methanomassiliicoccaceae archaeon]|jgi:Fic family protein|nr:Fic family protein [Methanomassiliicoccaceae archaeon]
MGYVPPFSLTDDMMQLTSEISELLGRIGSLEKLEKLPRLRRAGRIRTIHSSLAIENNTLTLDQVTDIIDGKKVLGPPDEILEVKNAHAAYKELENVDAFDMKELLRIHRIMMGGLIEENGRFRTVRAGVFASDGQRIYSAPLPDLVPGLMNDLFSWLRGSKAHMLIISSVFHYELEFIHPFRDGNGRMGRMWQTAILMNWRPIFAWIPIESIIRERQAEYYNAIRTSTKNVSSNEFILYMLKAILDAVKAIVSDAQKHINSINARMRGLLEVLETYPQSAAQLMERLNLRSRDAFRNNYLRPALEAGLVSLTEPGKPTSKNQMYFKR